MGAIASAVNLDNGVQDSFHLSEEEITYLGVPLGPLLFQDDVLRMSYTPAAAQAGNDRMSNVAESKLLDFNLKKSCYVVCGRNRRRQEIIEQIEQKPLELCGQPMLRELESKYLGDYICESGLTGSVQYTVNKRKKTVDRAIYEIRSVVNDCRNHILGGLVSGLELWESAVVPMLLYNSETWAEISKKTIDDLEGLQMNFLRTILGVGKGCPIPLLFSETGTLLMEYRILQSKLVFLHHLEQLPDSSLAKQVYTTQIKHGLPGIAIECQDFFAKFEIVDLKSYSKLQFKRLVKSKVRELNKSKLLELARVKQYKKVVLDELKLNDFKLKPYFRNLSFKDAKLKFKLVSHMTPTIKMNFQSESKFSEKLWVCEACKPVKGFGFRDTQEHVMVCSAYTEFREGRNLQNDKDLVEYFACVLQQRLRDL